MKGYFDNNATTPLCAAAREAWLAAADRHWHNPSSLYREAGESKRLLEDAREELADLIDAEPERIVFTSGATEANHAVFAEIAREKPTATALISAVEHPSVRESAWKCCGRDRTIEIPVTSRGEVDLDWLADRFRRNGDLAIVSAMAANNETGVLQPWREIADLCRENGAPFHCDSAQWIGKLPAKELGACDFVTGCAHKFGGPKGTGFLVVPANTSRFEIQAGGPQESGRRAGTEDLPGILGMLAALREKPGADLETRTQARISDRTDFELAIGERLPGSQIIAQDAPRLWNTVMLVVPPGHINLKWLTRLSQRGFAVSTGSACSAGKGNPSHVMESMGLSHGEMGRVIRVSGGWETSAADWNALAEAFVEVQLDLISGKRDAGALFG